MLAPSYDPAVVCLSIVVAAFVSYTALDLARHIHRRDGTLARMWTIGGALVMGSGIWSMHFVGMLAMTLPIKVGYAASTTFVSWLAAVAVSLFALAIAGRKQLGAATLGLGALVMGAGICAMHYIGMAALRMAPGIAWDARWVVASALIACGVSAVALLIFFGMRRLTGWRARAAQAAAALVMGLAISGMHYAGMAAAGFSPDSICLSAGGLGGRMLGMVIVVAVAAVLTVTLTTSAAVDAARQARAARLTRSLSDANTALQRAAFLDALTGLPNRALFEDRLVQAVARVERRTDRPAPTPTPAPARLALLYVDLDGFKPVNDSFGHVAGDAVLRQLGGRLRGAIRDVDTAARLGGDEFVLLLEEIGGVADAVAAAERVMHALAAPFEAAGRQLHLSASIGIVVYPDLSSADKLLTNADAAMYAAKRAGGASYAVFEARMNDSLTGQLDLLEDLRRAIAAGTLSLHYQPKVDCRSGRVRSVEALLRWHHPTRGPIGPGTLIPLAERFGLIVAIGDWVIEAACRQLAAWSREGRHMRVSINLSPHQLRQPDVAARVCEAIRRHGLDAGQLVCEITESTAMENTETTRRVLEELAAVGVKLSIDDFGTGYSSLAKLRRMRAHELKIDREFIADIAADSDARAVVDAIVRVGHALGLSIVAEGVETDEQRRVLIELGCDELQGFLFARPLPAEALLDDRLDDADDDEPLAFSTSVLAPDCPA